MRSLERLKAVRTALVSSKRLYFSHVWGMDIHPTVQLSLRADLDKTYPKGVHIAEYVYLAFGATVLCHDRTRGLTLDTFIERNCFIGAHAMILPGVRVGEGSIVGACAVVTKDVPSHSVVAGNPAKVIKTGIEVVEYGRLTSADKTEADLREQRSRA